MSEARGFGKGLSSLHSGEGTMHMRRRELEQARKEKYAQELREQINSRKSSSFTAQPRSVRLASTQNIDRPYPLSGTSGSS